MTTRNFFAAATPHTAVGAPILTNVLHDQMTNPQVTWFMAPIDEPKTLTVDNGSEFEITFDQRAIHVELLPASGDGRQFTITGKMPVALHETLPQIRFRRKVSKGKSSNPSQSPLEPIQVLPLPARTVRVAFFGMEDEPAKPGQSHRKSYHSKLTIDQMILAANDLLRRQANVQIQFAGLKPARVKARLPPQLLFSESGTDAKNEAWRKVFAQSHRTDADFSVFFVWDFEYPAAPGALAFTEYDENDRWYCFMKDTTGDYDGKCLAHETGHRLLRGFDGAKKHSPYKAELMWEEIQESGTQIYINTARRMNAAAPAGK